LKGQELPSCDFCGRKGHTETACHIKQNQWPLRKRTPRTEVLSGRRIRLKKLKPSTSKQEDSSSDEEEDDKDKKAFVKNFMASWKSSKKIRNPRIIDANVVIMILANLSKTIQNLLNLYLKNLSVQK
jgi:hypothetical protein